MPVPAVIAKIASGAKKANQARKQLKKAQAVADTVSNNEQGGPNITKIIMITAFVGPVVLIIFLGAIFTIIFQEGGYSVNIARAFGDEGTSTSGVQGATNYLEWAIKIANDDSHGYSQCNRTGPDYDCSSLVWYSLVEGAGISPEALGGYAFATGTMPGTLTKVGFKEHPYTGLDDLKPGIFKQ